jgi:hypothetical protein
MLAMQTDPPLTIELEPGQVALIVGADHLVHLLQRSDGTERCGSPVMIVMMVARMLTDDNAYLALHDLCADYADSLGVRALPTPPSTATLQ